MYRPWPSVMTSIPVHMAGRYRPVFLINSPVSAEKSATVTTSGIKYRPERRGEAPRMYYLELSEGNVVDEYLDVGLGIIE